MKYLQDYINWAREQMAKINPPKEKPIEQVVQAEEQPVKVRKPRKKKETVNVTN
jgi:hypothetical protein